jgi:flavin-dependent dehydrogenase
MRARRNGADHPIVIVGGGPAGSVAALCLERLGHRALVLERAQFPRYSVGESLLPGTLAILERLGVAEAVRRARFTRKSAATFVWGEQRAPWSFSFATPKTAPWIHDHSFQVTRAEYDRILLDAAAERGATVRQRCEVLDVGLDASGRSATVRWRDGQTEESLATDFVIDASGARGVTARKLGLRRWDAYYRNMAVWSYFAGGKRYRGALEGNTLSVAFADGWIWIIPLKDDIYSVGVIADLADDKLRQLGADPFYHHCLSRCPLAGELLAGARQSDVVRVVRDWSYDATQLSLGALFLAGDAACFIDPLFSQGVHLATYSAMLAAAAIDRLRFCPDERTAVHAWYDTAYRAAYERYHKFVAAFYACNADADSPFWRSRRIRGAEDLRFADKDWFAALAGVDGAEPDAGVAALPDRAAQLAELWQHGQRSLDDDLDANELALRRLRWAAELMKDLQALAAIHWRPAEVRLVSSYKVNPGSFRLEPQLFLGDETGRTMSAYPVSPAHGALFASLQQTPLSYRDLVAALKPLGGEASPLQLVGRLWEAGFLHGEDSQGRPARVRSQLRFGGVGNEDDLS